MSSYEDDLELARQLAGVARREIVPRFRNCTVLHKADGTEVTEADRAAEEAMRTLLASARPDDGILGEEYGGALGDGRVWVLDPIDGTTSFALGLPTFGTLVALVEDGEPVVGVIGAPAMDECVFAARGSGAWSALGDGKPERVQVSPVAGLDEAYASTTGIHGSDLAPPGEPRYRLSRILSSAQRFRFVTDCWQHALVARGVLHLAIDTIMAPWDVAAIVPVIEEAGGICTALDGSREGIVTAGSLLSASSAELHTEAREQLIPA